MPVSNKVRIRKKTILISLLAILVISTLLPLNTKASTFYDNIMDPYRDLQEDITGQRYAQDPKLATIIIIQDILAFLAIVFVILIIWSGFQWMTAGGNEDAITKARKRIINAVIGLVIILAAYAIAEFIINSIAEATTYGSVPE